MSEIERMIGEFLAKDPSHPVMVEIIGEIPDETRRRIEKIVRGKDLAEPVPTCPADCSGNIKETKQTVTIPLESYAQLLRSHAQLEVLRAMWDGGKNSVNAAWMLRSVLGWEKDGDNNAE